MALTCEATELPGVLLFTPEVFGDPRGFFMETFHAEKYARHGVPAALVQSNFSRSARGILRGLHYQLRHPQGKLVTALAGEIFDVAVDVRRGSPTFGRWVGHVLSGENHRQLWIPAGYAHGFSVLSDSADVTYHCTDFYRPEDERGIIWNDPELAVAWPLDGAPQLSGRDARHPRMAELPAEDLPRYAAD